MVIRRGKQKKSKKKLLIVLAVLVVATTGAIVWLTNRGDAPSVSTTTERTMPAPGEVNLDPPTEEDKAEVEQNKDELAEQQEQPAPPAKTASVIITYAAQYDQSIEVAAYVSNVFEDGGTCKLTLKNGSKTITRESTGFADARSTTCPPFSVPRSEFSAGTWKATVSYNSSALIGSSEEKSLEVK